MSTLAEQRAEHLAAAEKIVLRAKQAARDLTVVEAAEVESHIKAIDGIDAKQAREDRDRRQLDSLSRLGSPEVRFDPVSGEPIAVGGQGGRHFLSHTPEAMRAAAAFAAAAMRPAHAPPGVKALLPAGETTVTVPMLPSSPVAQGRPALGIFDVIPSVASAAEFGFLTQTSRVNAAAPVAAGALKPESVYGLERRAGRLRVVAHVSEGIDRFMLEDARSLERFVADELLYGLNDAVAGQVLAGDGLGEAMTGLAATSGVQAQAFDTDMILTARSALTLLQQTGNPAAPAAFILSPADWAEIETHRDADGGYTFAAAGARTPVDSASRRLWGTPVALANRQPAGVGWLVSQDALALHHDGAGARVAWSEAVGDDFQRNQLRARAEGRYDLAVYQPAGIVELTLVAV